MFNRRFPLTLIDAFDTTGDPRNMGIAEALRQVNYAEENLAEAIERLRVVASSAEHALLNGLGTTNSNELGQRGDDFNRALIKRSAAYESLSMFYLAWHDQDGLSRLMKDYPPKDAA